MHAHYVEIKCVCSGTIWVHKHTYPHIHTGIYCQRSTHTNHSVCGIGGPGWPVTQAGQLFVMCLDGKCTVGKSLRLVRLVDGMAHCRVTSCKC
jgi:hypothetical protein